MSKKLFRNSAQVIDIFNRRPFAKNKAPRTLRLAPETDGIVMLYGNDANPGKLFSLKIIGWGLQSDGATVGLVPWLASVVPCPELNDPLNGHWEGYYNQTTGQVFYQAPKHKSIELQAAQKYYQALSIRPESAYAQEIPDTIGTHAILASTATKNLEITEIFGWRLTSEGDVQGLLVNPAKVKTTPVLLGDSSLYPVKSEPKFKYYFQYCIANRIKNEDPEAIRAISLLIDY